MAAPMHRKFWSVSREVFNVLSKNCNHHYKYVWSRNFQCSSSCYSERAKGMKGRKLSSQLWLKRQLDDPYVKRARLSNYRCRSAFKLIEIDDKYKFLKPGSYVIDCGAAPGSWTQVAVERTRENMPALEKKIGSIASRQSPTVIGVDILGLSPVEGAKIFTNSDFTLPETQRTILQFLEGRTVDVVLSDMAPIATGHKPMDHENVIELCKSALRFSRAVLRPDGTFLCKIWQGGLEKDLMQEMKSFFKSVKIVKPLASRSDSAETFILSRGYKGLHAYQ